MSPVYQKLLKYQILGWTPDISSGETYQDSECVNLIHKTHFSFKNKNRRPGDIRIMGYAFILLVKLDSAPIQKQKKKKD